MLSFLVCQHVLLMHKVLPYFLPPALVLASNLQRLIDRFRKIAKGEDQPDNGSDGRRAAAVSMMNKNN